MELNIFEQTLLKLLRIRPMMTTGELADLTCLKADFVSALISSLIERGYLTEDNRPTDKVNEFAVRQESAEKMGVRLFAIRGTDKLLPIVCWDENNIIQGEYTNGSIRASWGSVG
ncbi:MAG: MarR family transcriptional regulator, partial [Synergistaceae bacterium]|nr:MarR family transcriptional regulator [Synergistaceae bacterium]